MGVPFESIVERRWPLQTAEMAGNGSMPTMDGAAMGERRAVVSLEESRGLAVSTRCKTGDSAATDGISRCV